MKVLGSDWLDATLTQIYIYIKHPLYSSKYNPLSSSPPRSFFVFYFIFFTLSTEDLQVGFELEHRAGASPVTFLS